MIKEISIRNFQSLHKVDVELDKFTVIVGASSVGKSAFTRAVRLLTENKRGTDFITYGERLATVAAETDKGKVVIQRGPKTDDNHYIVLTNDGEQVKYSKLSGETPAEVSKFLGIKSKDTLTYAGQFDKPYLLDAGASTVADVLGKLTNVSIIFDAARESNKQKTQNSTILKSKANDLSLVKNRIPEFKNLKPQLAHLEDAETLLEDARKLTESIERLGKYAERYDLALSIQGQLKPLLDMEVPDEEAVVAAASRVAKFDGVISNIRSAREAAKSAKIELEDSAATEHSLDLKYTEVLRLAGTCPTCGQGTSHLEHTETH
jgi:DNA repair ATPase RecN